MMAASLNIWVAFDEAIAAVLIVQSRPCDCIIMYATYSINIGQVLREQASSATWRNVPTEKFLAGQDTSIDKRK